MVNNNRRVKKKTAKCVSSISIKRTETDGRIRAHVGVKVWTYATAAAATVAVFYNPSTALPLCRMVAATVADEDRTPRPRRRRRRCFVRVIRVQAAFAPVLRPPYRATRSHCHRHRHRQPPVRRPVNDRATKTIPCPPYRRVTHPTSSRCTLWLTLEPLVDWGRWKITISEKP